MRANGSVRLYRRRRAISNSARRSCGAATFYAYRHGCRFASRFGAGARRTRRTRGAGSGACGRADGHRASGPPRRDATRRHDSRSRWKRPARGRVPAGTFCTAAPVATPSSARPGATASRSTPTEPGTPLPAGQESTSSTRSSRTRSADDCEIVTRQLSRDPFENVAQHETQVEPDSASFGSTIVTVFQSGRLVDGGAVGTGWATSVDAGQDVAQRLPRAGHRARQRSGRRLRPAPPRLADHDARRRARTRTQLLVSRSPDGLVWSRPEPVAADPAENYDKEWIACDTWRSSRFQGRCYLAYLEVETREIRIAPLLRRWADLVGTRPAPVDSPLQRGNGAFPVVRPDGALLVLCSVYGSIDPDTIDPAARGPRTAEAASSLPGRSRRCSTEDIVGVRAPPFVSADVDAGGHRVRDVGRLPLQSAVQRQQHRPRDLTGRGQHGRLLAGCRSGVPTQPSTVSCRPSRSTPRRPVAAHASRSRRTRSPRRKAAATASSSTPS